MFNFNRKIFGRKRTGRKNGLCYCLAAFTILGGLYLSAATGGQAYAQQNADDQTLIQLSQNNTGVPARPELRERMNEWTIGLAAGRIEGAPLRFAAELARVLDDGDKMRVLTIVTRGIFDNLNDLLYLKGVDSAIIYGDVLEEVKNKPDIRRNVNYIASLFPAEMHVMARPEIKSLEDLDGKVVNFNTKGTAAAYTGPIVFDRLGLKAVKTFIPHPIAIGKMKKSDEVAAVVFVSSKPLAPFVRGKWPQGFHFLPVNFSDALKEYYLPSALSHSDYPDLIPEGQRISTVSVPAVLAAFNWKSNTDRYRRMKRFVQYFFDRLENLQTQPGYHPKWKDVNLAAEVPGWKRFPPVEEILSEWIAAKKSRVLNTETATLSGVDKKLFQDFINWSKSSNEGELSVNTIEEQKQLFEAFLKWANARDQR